MKNTVYFGIAILSGALMASSARAQPREFLEKHCYSCHDSESKKGGLDLTALKASDFRRWLKVHDRLEAGEMPPKKKPAAAETTAALASLHALLLKAEPARQTGLRRLTRVEYENTLRDLLDLPGIPLQGELPADGTAHGFDNNSDALDISHVNLAKYIESADRALDMAIATQPRPPSVTKQRISLANPHGFVAHVLLHGDGVLLKNKQPDPDFPPAGEHMHLDQGAHERLGSFSNGSSVGLFRHEDESFHPYFIEFVTIYPGQYRVKTSLWSFKWDKGKVLPARGTEAVRLSIVTLTGDGRGGGHPSTVLGYYDAPPNEEKVHDFVTWLNKNEIIGFNAASLAPGAQTRGKLRAMGFTGPGIVCDYLDIEGPLHDVWPPRSHRALFGDLPIVEFKPAEHPKMKGPKRSLVRQEMGAGKNRPDKSSGVWTVHSNEPLADADRLLANFLPRAFRRPVEAATRKQYVAKVEERLKAGDCFETAMRWAYRAALCSPDFLYHVEPTGKLDDHALACRLSYFFWRSMPDAKLIELANAGRLHDPDVLRAQSDRLWKDPKSQRFVEDFLGQWLKLRLIAATDPDRKLYPEFSPYLQDSMVGETRAYFRELFDRDLGARYLVKSDFAMLNERLAVHYGIPGVKGAQIRRVPLPADSPRGPFLTQASILKITANGTTTSPVPRGAFVMERILGQTPEPPPPNIPAIEPDVRGARTIREQLDKHRTNPSCASCHAKIDPPGFALESFDVIGGMRSRYRSIGAGDPAPRGAIDPFIGISFKLGPHVDASGQLADGRTFKDVREFQDHLSADSSRLLKNLARQFAIYGIGRDLGFADRAHVGAIVTRTEKQGGGVRTLVNELIQSPLFSAR
jgi:Protein of unknown function (DUF1592)/Protein of unknown function (DUF1588)/Protein of unknown function (DUF1587)/Protein of unknown function (DUF1595)/Protein of unknown function (DUF1585)